VARLRVLHCPTSVGGNPTGLARAERALGLASEVVVVDPPPFGYEADVVLAPPGTRRLTREARRWRLLLRAVHDFDVVHFNFGQTIAPSFVPLDNARPSTPESLFGLYARLTELRDLPLLRRAGKAIVVTFQGGDARQSDVSRAKHAITYATEIPTEYRYDARRRWKIARFDRYADRIYALNPDLLDVLPARAEFLPYASVDPREHEPVDRSGSGTPVLVHAPTDHAIKGTRFVRAAVERLRDEGVELEYVQAEGLSRADTQAALRRADLVVDQLLAGWYGGVAVEAMAVGAPVICYLREDDLRVLPTEMRGQLPLLVATPETVYEVLKEWLTTRRGELPELGRRSRAFVERWHDPLRIAEGVKRGYEEALARVRRPVSPTPQSRSAKSSR
jgi:hypothetical protein